MKLFVNQEAVFPVLAMIIVGPVVRLHCNVIKVREERIPPNLSARLLVNYVYLKSDGTVITLPGNVLKTLYLELVIFLQKLRARAFVINDPNTPATLLLGNVRKILMDTHILIKKLVKTIVSQVPNGAAALVNIVLEYVL